MVIAPLQKAALEDWFGTRARDLIDQFTRFHFGEFNAAGSNTGSALRLANNDVAETARLGASSGLSLRDSVASKYRAKSLDASVTETYWDKLYRARQQIQSNPSAAQTLLITCADLDIFIAPHALRSLAELHAMKKEFDQENKVHLLVQQAQARAEHWQDTASELDITAMPLRSSTLAPLIRSKIIVALRKFGAASATLVATTIPGYPQYEHLFFVLEFNGDFDAASDAICTVRVDGFTHWVIDYDELDERFLQEIQAIQKSRLY